MKKCLKKKLFIAALLIPLIFSGCSKSINTYEESNNSNVSTSLPANVNNSDKSAENTKTKGTNTENSTDDGTITDSNATNDTTDNTTADVIPNSDTINEKNVESTETPIDKAFKKDFEIASSTVELNFLAEKYLEAWKQEWDNVINEIKKRYQFEEDKERVNKYKESYEEFVKAASEFEFLNWSDTSVESGDNRTFGTGAVSAMLMEEAALYKKQVLHLIDKYFTSNYGSEQDPYNFIYKSNGAEIEKLQSRNQE